jgi:hypothetical protein
MRRSLNIEEKNHDSSCEIFDAFRDCHDIRRSRAALERQYSDCRQRLAGVYGRCVGRRSGHPEKLCRCRAAHHAARCCRDGRRRNHRHRTCSNGWRCNDGCRRRRHQGCRRYEQLRESDRAAWTNRHRVPLIGLSPHDNPPRPFRGGFVFRLSEWINPALTHHQHVHARL